MPLNSYDVSATNCVVVFAVMSCFGLTFLMAATDGGSVHGFGLLGGVSVRGRMIALIGANLVFLIPLVGCWIFGDISPIGLAHGANIWWSSKDIDFFGKIVAIVTYWVLFSPIQCLVAIFLIRRASSKEKRHQHNAPSMSTSS